jgi:hypoxanthine phosphoribosyltransferase
MRRSALSLVLALEVLLKAIPAYCLAQQSNIGCQRILSLKIAKKPKPKFKLISFQQTSSCKRGNAVENEAEFEVPTWNQIHRMLLSQAEKIRQSSFKPDIIIAISRGGWLPARVLSDLLETSLDHVKVEYYIGVAETKTEPVLQQGVSTAVMGKKVLIVDDVADTGESLKLVKEHITQHGAIEVRTATVYYKPWSVVKPEYYERHTRRWVVFPWEMKETIRKIVEKRREKHLPIEEVTAKLVRAGLPKQLVEKFLKEIFEEREC